MLEHLRLPALMGVALALTVTTPALAAPEEQAALIFDTQSHVDRAVVSQYFCGSSTCLPIEYLHCTGGTCFPASPAADPDFHESKVARVLLSRLRSALPDTFDAPFRLFSVTGDRDSLSLWLLQTQEVQEPSSPVVTRAEYHGIRTIVETGGGRGPGQACQVNPYAAQLRGVGVVWVAAAGNNGLNGFLRVHPGVREQNAIFCGPDVISVAATGTTYVTPEGVVCNPSQDAGCFQSYPLASYSNFHPVHTPFAAEGCDQRWLNGPTASCSSSDIGTSFAAPAVAGTLMALFRRNPTLTPNEALTLLRGQSSVVSFNAPSGGNSSFHELNSGAAYSLTQAQCAYSSVYSPRPANGFWYNPKRSGSGLFFHAHADGQESASWYTYDSAGDPTWYTLQGAYPQRSRCWVSGLYRTTWNASTQQPSTVLVGQVRTVVGTNGKVAFSYQFTSGARGSQPLQFLAPPSTGAPGYNLTGPWYDPNQPGWGYSISSNGDGHFISAFLFDKAGQPRWAQGTAIANTSTSYLTATLATYRNPGRCPGCTAPFSRTDYPNVGSVRLQNSPTHRWMGGEYLPAPHLTNLSVCAYGSTCESISWSRYTYVYWIQ